MIPPLADPFHDVRAVHDMAALRTDAIVADAWVLLELIPDPYSGGAMTVGASVDADSGVLIDDATRAPVEPGAARSGLAFSGTWKRVDSGPRERAPREGRYEWIEPRRGRLHRLAADDLYDPFARGGTVMCRYDASESGRERFASARVVLPGWAPDLEAAREALRADLELAERRDAVAIVDGNNAVLATIAFRTLAEQRTAVARAHEYRLAVFVYLLMRRTEDDDAIEAALAALPSDPYLALGACAVRLLDPSLPASQPWVSALLATQRDTATPYVRTLLQAMGLDA